MNPPLLLLSWRIFVLVSSPEEKKKRERDEEEKRILNEQAFKGWLKMKEEQRIQEQKKRNEKAPTVGNSKKSPSQENSVSVIKDLSVIWVYWLLNGCIMLFLKCTSSEESKSSFEAWLKRKQEQIEREREYRKQLEHVVTSEKQAISPEERTKAYKE